MKEKQPIGISKQLIVFGGYVWFLIFFLSVVAALILM